MKYHRFINVLAVVSLMFAVFGLSYSPAIAAGGYRFGADGWSQEPSAKHPSYFTPKLYSVTGDDGGPRVAGLFTNHTLPRLGNSAASILSRKFGLNQLMGKHIGDRSERAGMDNPVAVEGERMENEPSMAVNPYNEMIVVVFTHYYNDDLTPDACQAMVSYDGGVTFNFNDYAFPPITSVGCSDPVVRFSPDGEYAYYFYMDLQDNSTPADDTDDYSNIVMQRAFGSDPTTFDGSPVTVFNGFTNTVFFDKEWGDVHTYDYINEDVAGGVLYATATAFESDGDCAIAFNVSYDNGSTWQYLADNPLYLNYSSGCSPVLQGSRPIGGMTDTSTVPTTGFMAACWYNSWGNGNDGWRLGKFWIECITHDEFAKDPASLAGWSPYYYPGGLRAFELPYYLGPNESYHRYWGSMFPVLAVDDGGGLYVGTTVDPTDNDFDTEAGNSTVSFRYLDYGILGAFTTNFAGKAAGAQIFPSIAARWDPVTSKYAVFFTYSNYISGNKFYNIVYRKGLRTYSSQSISFGGVVMVSDRPSPSAFDFQGDYNDSALSGRKYHLVWTDRQDVYDKFEVDTDVMHDMFLR